MKSFLIFIIIILLLIIASTFAYHIKRIYDIETDGIENIIKHEENKKENVIILNSNLKEVEIFKSNARPIAVMIDNTEYARPQSGLNNAYMVYEIIGEGTFTRIMALYKGVELNKVGPIESSRNYFLDYVLENDAIYVRYGGTTQAEKDISTLEIDDINGIEESSSSFWRVSDKSLSHNVVTSTEKILNIVERKGYRTISEKQSVLNYTTEEVKLSDGITAKEIILPYSTSYEVNYKYDNISKRYIRGVNGTIQREWETDDLITAKNIIIIFAKNIAINEASGEEIHNLLNIGTLNGYYITNGKAIEIECYKESREAKTVYRDLEGNEIQVNDGNTFVQIVPIDTDVKIEPGETGIS